MATWIYKAYDASMDVQEGTIEAENFEQLALQLRRRRLQVYDARIATRTDPILQLDRRVAAMRGRFRPRPVRRRAIRPSILLSVVWWVISLIRWAAPYIALLAMVAFILWYLDRLHRGA